VIGLFDTGHGGLTVAQELRRCFPHLSFLYFGDHARSPYGKRTTEEIISFTLGHVEMLFASGCSLVVLACNTATAAALRTLQQEWLPQSAWRGKHNVLGIIAPTVEVITQTRWNGGGVYHGEEKHIGVFGTERTIKSGVYEVEIIKRFPKAKVTAVACAGLAGAIEAGESEDILERQVEEAVRCLKAQVSGQALDHVLLGCTHYPLVEPLFRKYLSLEVEIFSQPKAVAAALKDYLHRHPEYIRGGRGFRYLTSGDLGRVQKGAERFLGERLFFEALNQKVPE
jgi:glutamate racemase